MNGAVDVLAVMNRYDKADSLDGLRGFNRDAFFIADAARSFMRIADAFLAAYGAADDGAIYAKSEASRRFATLRRMRSNVGGAK